MGSGGVVPCIFNLGTRLWRQISFTHQLFNLTYESYILTTGYETGGSQSRSARSEGVCQSLSGFKPRFRSWPGLSLTVLTELFQTRYAVSVS
jgi:hypothetical protein